MFKLILLFFAICSLSYALSEKEYQQLFTEFMQNHNKVYFHDEFQTRYQTFKTNVDFIQNFDSASRGFTVAINKFADLTVEEFSKMYTGYKPLLGQERSQNIENLDVDAPESWDWRKEGAVTHVKNQGQCGSCWSFSATGSTEGVHFRHSKKLVSLSEQNLVDCSVAEGNHGCNGGLMDYAFKYIIKNDGIDKEECYPYKAAGPESCKFKKDCVGARISSYHDVKSGSESDLKAAVYHTPTSVAIDASHSSFQFYHSGVYYEPACSSSRLDHGVLAVGYGAQDGKAYWLVKNSWGTDWGLQGYIHMSRNRDNNCGIATTASYPKV